MTEPARPLVSIGLPTLNRSDLLKQALDALLAQDYRPLEIVVSDNASTDATEQTVAAAAAADPTVTVHYHRRTATVPAVVNFRSVLELATGTYFMWAADDDAWEPSFVSALAAHLDEHPETALVAAEARYRLPDGTPLPFFAEGTAFYDHAPLPVRARLARVVDGAYGNLIYGLYRRDALVGDDAPALDGWRSANEIPVFLRVAVRGEVHVLPQVLFHKTAPLPVYVAAAREQGQDVRRLARVGRVGAARRMRFVADMARYHAAALEDSWRAVRRLPVAPSVRVSTATRLGRVIGTHLVGTALRTPILDVEPR